MKLFERPLFKRKRINLNYLLLVFLVVAATNTFAQIGIGTNTPAASAALEVASSTNNKGILIPRITATQKDAISNPAEGLMIYQTSAPAGFYYYMGSAWKLIMTQTDLDTKLSTLDATTSLNTKVDKVTGKELSSNDYTTVEKVKVSNLSNVNTGDQSTITGNAGTATKLATAKNINGEAFDGSRDITVKADAGTLTGTTLNTTVIGSSLTTVGTLAGLTVTNPIVGSVTGSSGSATGNAATATLATNATKLATVRTIGGVSFDGSANIDLPGVNALGNQNTSGNAGTATKLATAKNINGEAFDGSGDITLKADAGTLTGTTLNAAVTGSSLTTVGTLAGLTVTNPIVGSVTGSSGSTTGNAATATLATNATKLATVRTIGGVSFDGSANIDLPGVNALGNQNTSGNAGTATKLATAKNINGEAFDGSGDITLKADAGTLTGTTLNATVTGSSLTTVGTLASATVSGKVIVGAPTATSASAVLEASSTSQGFLPPRMTGAQRNQIASPAIGLMVYCTNCGSAGGEPQYYNGSAWVNMIGGAAALMPPPAIGDAYQGGIIAYILVPGDPGYNANTPHGLIAATSDQSTFIGWDIDMDHPTYQSGILIGTGSANTNAIFTLRGPSTDYAVGLVKAYRGGNYNDWYLPSLNELKKLLINKVEIGGFEPTNYWTSSEYESGPNSAYYVNFGNPGYEQIYGKTIGFRVRAVRSF